MAMRQVQVDHDALQRAMAMVRDESPGRARQIDDMLKDRPWLQVAQFAAYSCQHRTLHLKPWQSPPCTMGDAEPIGDLQQHGLHSAWELRRKLLTAGLSMYEPDPVGVLAEMENQNQKAQKAKADPLLKDLKPAGAGPSAAGAGGPSAAYDRRSPRASEGSGDVKNGPAET
jgi:hypothetical protein